MTVDNVVKAIVTAAQKNGIQKEVINADTVILLNPDSVRSALKEIKENATLPRSLDTRSINPKFIDQPIERGIVEYLKKEIIFRSLHCQGNIGVRISLAMMDTFQNNYYQQIDFLSDNLVKVTKDFKKIGYKSSSINNLAQNIFSASLSLPPATKNDMLDMASSFSFAITDRNKNHPFQKQKKEYDKFEMSLNKLVSKALKESWSLHSVSTFHHSFFEELIKLFWSAEVQFDHDKLSPKLNKLVKVNNNIMRLDLARNIKEIELTKKYLADLSINSTLSQEYQNTLLSKLQHYCQMNVFDVARLDNHNLPDVYHLVEYLFNNKNQYYKVTYAFYRFLFPYLQNWELSILFNKYITLGALKSDISNGFNELRDVMKGSPELEKLFDKLKDTDRLYLIDGGK